MPGIRAFFLPFLLSVLFVAGNALAAPLPVVVSIAPQKYLVERIAGDAVSISVLVTPGSDPHSYEPTPSQMRDCANASLYFTIGLPFEDAWLPRLGSAAKNLRVVSMIKGIQRLPSTDKDEAPGSEDPHVWLSPMLVRAMLPGIARELGKALPDQAPRFRANAAKLSAELEALDAEIAQMFAAVPQKKRVFLTFHPAWTYFAHNYELKELCIEVEGKEPGPQTMKAVIDAAKAYALNTIFVEPQFPQAAAQAIADALGAKIEKLDPLAEELPENLRQVAKLLAASFTGKR